MHECHITQGHVTHSHDHHDMYGVTVWPWKLFMFIVRNYCLNVKKNFKTTTAHTVINQDLLYFNI